MLKDKGIIELDGFLRSHWGRHLSANIIFNLIDLPGLHLFPTLGGLVTRFGKAHVRVAA